mmetsp:Transcript_35012/g.99242  ORF Transcript_35012/g.99242 Transcript_35012/m.99242 type:complete len:176 (-) Transcript_35012:92-619(-)|eukprot:CAMPEP_0117657018 /NCGR_PEP_ID=MMETSP0804-20121206/5110_1 /TAXON_ID=1074897 /ORGANISM="Tetraselmis astigmatica, Strain CCMP880" /LENGTH=175 /DNA_ID=CAMNT_0005463451 /DNA_START=113 /DNA_END=640 /DNA_ORIENTATION=-
MASEQQPMEKQATEEIEWHPNLVLVPIVFIVGFALYSWFADSAVSIKYKADVNDYEGHKKSFEFKHNIRRRGQLKPILEDEQRTEMMLTYLSDQHLQELMGAEKWLCIECGKKAHKLVPHPQSYLHLKQPMVIDTPGPVCKSAKCLSQHKINFEEMMKEVRAMELIPPTSEHKDD